MEPTGTRPKRFAAGSATASWVTFSRPACLMNWSSRSDSTASARSTSTFGSSSHCEAHQTAEFSFLCSTSGISTEGNPAASPTASSRRYRYHSSPEASACTRYPSTSEMNMRRASSRTSSHGAPCSTSSLMRASSRSVASATIPFKPSARYLISCMSIPGVPRYHSVILLFRIHPAVASRASPAAAPSQHPYGPCTAYRTQALGRLRRGAYRS